MYHTGGEEMYKIELYDYNCCPTVDGTVHFFTDDIEDFQKKWFKLEKDKDRKKRFLRSKAGEIVVDYYSDDPEMNIVQYDDAHTYAEQDITLNDVTFESTNAYLWTEKYHVDQWNIHFKWISFKNRYYRIASYLASGVCLIDTMFFPGRLERATCYGNKVLINKIVYKPKYPGRVPESEWPHPTYEDFKFNTIQTICYLMNGWFPDEKALLEDINHFEVTDQVQDRLFADVIGEAG